MGFVDTPVFALLMFDIWLTSENAICGDLCA